MLRNLKAEFARHGIKGVEVAKLLDITPRAVSQKINQKSEFTRSEMFKIYNTYFKDKDMAELFLDDKKIERSTCDTSLR